MLLMGLLTLPLMWDVARRIGGRDFALTALFLLALNPWHMVMKSRWALEASMLPHVVLLAAELLLIGTRRRWALYLSMVVFGLAPYAYGLAAVSVPCILLPYGHFPDGAQKGEAAGFGGVRCHFRGGFRAVLRDHGDQRLRAGNDDARQDDHAAL